MTSTRNQKAKRGKTRRTRRKTRTVHRGGWPGRNNPEPTIRLEHVKKYLEDKSLLTTLKCLTKELENRTNPSQTKIYLCDAPCDSKQQSVADTIQSQTPVSLSTGLTIKHPNVWTENNRNPNGWYIEVQNDRNYGESTSIRNAYLKNMSDYTGNINGNINGNGIVSGNFQTYMDGIDKLPNPFYYYSTDIKGAIHTFSLKSTDVGSKLIWYDNETNPMVSIIDYNPENPLTITIKGTEYTLTKVE